MSEHLVLIEDRGDFAILTLNRPDKRNAMNRRSRAALLDALHKLEGGPRAVIITGNGAAFCAGMDLKEQAGDRSAGVQSANTEWRDVNIAIRQHSAIFIAAVNGHALGGGLTLINVCDLAIAADSASIGMPEITFATYPGLAGPSTQLSLARKRAAWMILTGERINGQTAEDWGIVNRCVPSSELMQAAEALAKRIVGFDSDALAASKRALDVIPSAISDWRQAFDFGELTNAAIRERTDAQEGRHEHFGANRKNSGQSGQKT